MRQPKRNEAVPRPEVCSSLQDGSCLTTARILPKASPLDSGRAFALRFSRSQKGRKGMMKKSNTTGRFQRRRTLRITVEEDARITQQAATAGISVSEYMRRLFFGSRPVIARTDDQTIRELRRHGGLLKHHFDVVQRTKNTASLAELDAALRAIRGAIEALSKQ